jgi:hypothetical protein
MPIDRFMSLLPALAARLQHRHSGNANVFQHFLDVLELFGVE